MTKSIYNLELHESVSVESSGEDMTTYWQVMRVASGWIYTLWGSEEQRYLDLSIFVSDPKNTIPKGGI